FFSTKLFVELSLNRIFKLIFDTQYAPELGRLFVNNVGYFKLYLRCVTLAIDRIEF
ncbi:MAG: hypothetical protein ACI96P_000629, partial [Candidatus Azotimanducaceae bacterium]